MLMIAKPTLNADALRLPNIAAFISIWLVKTSCVGDA